jgi:hypothetical protein
MLKFTISSFVVFVIVLTLTLASKLFEYNLWCIFGKDIPWYGDLVGGILTNCVAIPVAIFCWIAQMCNVAVPFIQQF